MKWKYYKVVMVLAVLFSVTCSGAVIYVDDDAVGNNDGSSWVDAFVYLQDALAVAEAGDEIWVAEGVYKPDQGGGNVLGDREATFQLISGVGLYGGFAGYENSLDDRDWEANASVLSGDLNGDDREVEDIRDLLTEPTRAENSYNVLIAIGLVIETELNGFTIKSGNGNSWYSYSGGGMDAQTSNLVIRECRFAFNSASQDGGGLCIKSMRNMKLVKCTFNRNYSERGGGICSWYSNPIMIACVFESNVAHWFGGALHNETSTPQLSGCSFIGNVAYSMGGAVFCTRNESPVIANCLFMINWARHAGGAFVSLHGGESIINCTFWGNAAGVGGGGAIFAARYSWDAKQLVVENSITLNNTSAPGDALRLSGTPLPSQLVLHHCDIRGGEASIHVDPGCTLGWGDGNVDVDPMFVRVPDDGGNGWGDDPTTPDVDEGANDDYGDLHLLSGSPCIDVGDDTALPPDTLDLDGDGDTEEPIPFDLDGNPRIDGVAVDMGAYEAISNIAPVADPGEDQNSPILFEAYLDGSNSYDPDEDYPLTYYWQILDQPIGSTAELSDPQSATPAITPDLVGDYLFELIVTDSKGLPSEPNYVVITAIPIEEEVENELEKIIDEIGNLDPDDFKNPNSANALINMIEAALKMVEKGNYKGALNKLSNDILKKTDGCANTGQPDKNDWILTCEDQEKVYPLVVRAIELLQRLLE